MRAYYQKINGLKLRSFSWGKTTNPTVLFVHGWLDTGASFDFLCQHLMADFHCVAFDMRGYGKSGHSKSPLGYFFNEYVADAAAMVDAVFKGEPARLVGHSLGGAVFSNYAGAFPERVSHLVNIEGFGLKDLPSEGMPARVRKWIEGLDQQRFQAYPTLKAFSERLMQSNPNLPKDRALFLARHLTEKTKKGFQMAADANHKLPEPYWTPSESFTAFWRQISAKCLLVLAENTEMAKWFPGTDYEAELEKRLRCFPSDSKRIVISDAGHMTHHEKPQELAAEISRFLKGNP